MKLYIKYMVSMRCKELVKEELEKLGVKSEYVVVDLGVVEVLEGLSESKKEQLKENLHKEGLEVLDTHKSLLLERIKKEIVMMVHDNDELPRLNPSEYLSEKLGYDYTYLSNIFSEVKGTTIQQFIILHKIERVKELLLYNELNLSEIAHKLQYSSVSHLSHQFKKVTGLTPTFFKKIKEKRMEVLDQMS